MSQLRARMIRDMAVRGFSPRTHEAYIAAVVRDLEFTILQILDKSTAEKEALDREVLFKRKLGTRASGVNVN